MSVVIANSIRIPILEPFSKGGGGGRGEWWWEWGLYWWWLECWGWWSRLLSQSERSHTSCPSWVKECQTLETSLLMYGCSYFLYLNPWVSSDFLRVMWQLSVNSPLECLDVVPVLSKKYSSWWTMAWIFNVMFRPKFSKRGKNFSIKSLKTSAYNSSCRATHILCSSLILIR